MAGVGGGGAAAAEGGGGGARKVLARSTSFGEYVEADDDVADAGDDVGPRAAGGGGGGAAGGFRASSAGPVPTLPGSAVGAAGGGHHAGGVARAAAMHRSATSPEGVLQRPGTALGTSRASELKALRHSKSYSGGGDSGAGGGGLLMSPILGTVREGASAHAHAHALAHAQPARHRARRLLHAHTCSATKNILLTSLPPSPHHARAASEGRPASAHWHEGLMLSRGGMHRPKSAYIFSMVSSLAPSASSLRCLAAGRRGQREEPTSAARRCSR